MMLQNRFSHAKIPGAPLLKSAPQVLLKRFSHAKIPVALCLLPALLGLLTVLAPRTLRLNVTSSLPLGLYRIAQHRFDRGSLIETCLPADVTRLALDRGYIGRGPCPGDARPLLKAVLALPGDRLVLTRLGVARNGSLHPFSAPRFADSFGRPLPRPSLGLYRIPPGSVWLFAPHLGSFDSRYFGPVSDRFVRATVVPFLTAPS